MKIQRTIPPAATPMSAAHLLHGLAGIILGKRYLNRLSEEFKDYFGIGSVFFVSSGRAALYLILQALKSLSPKQQVVIPAYTCFFRALRYSEGWAKNCAVRR